MRPHEILTHLRKQPFEPIRIFISDGANYEVRHPEIAAVSQTTVAIGLEPFAEGVPARFAYCDPVHVTRIEPLNGSKTRRRAKRPGRK